MYESGCVYNMRDEHEKAAAWFTKAAEAGLPKAMFNVASLLDAGKGGAAPDYPAALEWYRRAADAGIAEAAYSLSNMYCVGRGRACQILPAASFLHI